MLPMRILNRLRLGVTPEINSISTILIALVTLGVGARAAPGFCPASGRFPMSAPEHELANRFFGKAFAHLTAVEQRVIRQFLQRRHTARDISEDAAERATFGERIADRVAAFGGSWPFIFLFLGIMVGWVVLNSYILIRLGETFDPYPYILLNLFLSMLAAIQAPVIMMSQNRQAVRDRADQRHDYEVNLKTEMELMQLHEKLDVFVQQNWGELLKSQQHQIELLQRVVERLGKSADDLSDALSDPK